MWTNISSPPWVGRMKPCPWDLEKFLQTPLKTGPDLDLTVLIKQRQWLRESESRMHITESKANSVTHLERWHSQNFSSTQVSFYFSNTVFCSDLRRVGAIALGRKWTMWLPGLWRFPLPNMTAPSQKREREWERSVGFVQQGIRWGWSVWISHHSEESEPSEPAGFTGWRLTSWATKE